MVTKEEGINLEFGINRCTFYIQKKTTRTYSIAQGKQLKCPSTRQCISKLWYIHRKTTHSNKKEQTTDLYYNMDKFQKYAAQKSIPYGSIYKKFKNRKS